MNAPKSSIHPVALPHAYRLLNTGPTVLVSAAVGSAQGGQRYVMAAAWNMPLDFDPPKVAVVLDKSTHTRKLVEQSGRFTLAVPCVQGANLAFAVGSQSQATHAQAGTVKADVLGVQWLGAADLPGLGSDTQAFSAALVAGCVGWLVCRLLPEPHNQQAYDLFIGQVTHAWADERAFANGKYRPLADIPPALRTLHHLGAGRFVVPGQELQATTG
jgi:flavin reductase (DIM6/NTAB) family NADH-FMN oxidoreductase RutF